MSKIKMKLAIFLGKTSAFISRHFGFGRGSNFPGRVALRIDPKIVRKITYKIKKGSILITGTNGKTTTSRMLSSIIKCTGLVRIHNSFGANLITGVASTLVSHSNYQGSTGADLGLFEIDEATLRLAIPEINPKFILFTNLFRDQLDRYGEVNKIIQLWEKCLINTSSGTKILLNSDDPGVASLGRNLDREVWYYGVEDKSFRLDKIEHASDSTRCPKCGLNFQYDAVFYSHLGHFSCPKCNFKRPKPQIYAQKIEPLDSAGNKIHIVTPVGDFQTIICLPGFYNIYNALAAISAALALGFNLQTIKAGLEVFSSVFGRQEQIQIGSKKLLMILVKNPAGFNEVLRTFSKEEKPQNLILALNDKIADGRDVSWIWDVDFEILAKKDNFIVTTGIRAEDMALRLKYAGVDTKNIYLEKDYKKALDKILSRCKEGETVNVYPSYTTMLEMRKVVEDLGYVSKYVEE